MCDSFSWLGTKQFRVKTDKIVLLTWFLLHRVCIPAGTFFKVNNKSQVVVRAIKDPSKGLGLRLKY